MASWRSPKATDEGEERPPTDTPPVYWLKQMTRDPVATLDRISKEFFHPIKVKISDNDITEFLKNKTTGRNRSNKIPCLDSSRVILKVPTGENDYIHANWVRLTDTRCRLIVTQAPLAQTATDFWSMVWEEHVVFIVCLTKIQERGEVKTFEYWPTICGYKYQKQFGKVIVRGHSVSNQQHAAITMLEFVHTETREIRRIKQYLCLEWPDKEAPLCADAILELVAFMDQEMERRKCHLNATMLIHSCTGAGRAGTLAALYELVTAVKMNMMPNVVDAVVKVRQQRAMAVHGEDQYMFLYWATVLYILKTCNVSDEFKIEVMRRLQVMCNCSTKSNCAHSEVLSDQPPPDTTTRNDETTKRHDRKK